jgi:uncharacterized protein
VIALVNPKDNHHRQALELADVLLERGTRLVSTMGVILEIGNALAKVRNRHNGEGILLSLLNDDSVTVLPLTKALIDKGFKLYTERTDKEWGLTDCCSFVIMTEAKLTQALTADHHYHQAGFEPMLLSSNG